MKSYGGSFSTYKEIGRVKGVIGKNRGTESKYFQYNPNIMFRRNAIALDQHLWNNVMFRLTDAELSRVGVKDGNFVDQHGRVLMFRGINSVIKRFPW